jgi:serine/threonine-protein kinase ATR
LSEEQQSRLIEYLAMIACAANGSLVVTHDHAGAIHYSKCDLCEGIQPPTSLALVDEAHRHPSQAAVSILSKLVKSKVFQASRRPRVLGMIAVRRFTVHYNDRKFVDLGMSPLGQWSLTSLHSSMRELRILGG